MRLLVAAVTMLFVVVGGAGLVGGVAAWWSARGAITPDGLALFNSGFIISFSLLMLGTAVFFAKSNWRSSSERQ
jgi:hypothetical protein